MLLQVVLGEIKNEVWSGECQKRTDSVGESHRADRRAGTTLRWIPKPSGIYGHNLPAHKVMGIEQAIESRGSTLVYLPPYSPDFSPIEQCWSKVKTRLRKAKARDRDTLDKAIVDALGEVTESDAIGWFRHCGYAIHSN